MPENTNTPRQWAKAIALPHLVTMLLLLPAAPLWLLGGFIGLAISLPYLHTWNAAAKIALAVLLVAAVLVAGWKRRHEAKGRYLVSLGIWLWFALGFFCLAQHY